MNKKVFIIEDDANILYGLQAKFSVLGAKVATSTGDDELINIMRQMQKYQPDFIILDVLLPVIDGFEILRYIKGDENLSNAPVFIFADLSEEDLKQKCKSLGADYCFVKNDFNLDEFVNKIKKIIQNLHDNSLQIHKSEHK